jgi:hypothetical protein
MSLKIKKKSGSSVPPMEAGTYPAVCVGIVDLGEQYSETFKKYSDKLLVIWEIPSQTIEIDGEDKPRWLSKDFSASLNEKSNLYQTLVSWRGKAFTENELTEDENGFMQFSVLDMLGTGCFLQVIVEEKDGNSYNRITSVISLPAGMSAPTTETPLIAFDMDAWDDEVFNSLPVWIQDRIKKSTQYQKLHVPTDPVDVDTSGGQNQEQAQKEENPI